MKLLILSILALAISQAHSWEDINIAIDKVALQTSTEHSGFAQKAVDSNASPHFNHHTCTHTRNHNKPWWMVDLLEKYVISRVAVVNRNGWEYRLNNFEVWVGKDENHLWRCGRFNGRAHKGQKFNFKGCQGRNVRIVKIKSNRRDHLTICEVQVFGHRQNGKEELYNVAKNRPAKQSSTWHSHQASLATDGSIDSQGSKVAHTNLETNPWWQVNLGYKYRISRVAIYNHNGWGHRLRFYRVELSNSGHHDDWLPCYYNQAEGMDKNVQVVPCKGKARFLRIRLYEHEHLTLGEVKVYGKKIAN